MIIDYKLTYPSGTATAVLINGFHTKKGDQNARFDRSSLPFEFRAWSADFNPFSMSPESKYRVSPNSSP